jgi:hypothetical protein
LPNAPVLKQHASRRKDFYEMFGLKDLMEFSGSAGATRRAGAKATLLYPKIVMRLFSGWA